MSSDKTLSEISEGPIPRHVAIVMDGNGRWAQQRGLPRPLGHAKGAEILEEIVKTTIRLGIKRLTLYCFSNENWKRPQSELEALMALLKKYMVEQRPRFMEEGIRVRVLGRRDRLSDDALREIDETVKLTESNDVFTLALAINYGARQEIVDAVRNLVRDLSDLKKREAAMRRSNVDSVEKLVTENAIAQRLYDGDAPDPDLFIRTGGEQRLSNYLLWQLSYAELWFTDVLWPDFTPELFEEAIRAFQSRHRRFGGLDKESPSPKPR